MAATSRRRRICCRSAGAWATAAPRPPRASPRPGPPRSPPRTSSPGSTSRRRCPWPRTQVSAGRRGPRAPALLPRALARSLRFRFPAPATAAVPARSEVSRPRGRGDGSSRVGVAFPGALSTGQPEAAPNGLAPAARPAEPQPRSLPLRPQSQPETFRAGQRGARRGDNAAVGTGRAGGRGGPGRRAGARGARSWGCGVRRANPVSIKSLQVSGREWVCRGASAGASASGIPAPAGSGGGRPPGFRCRRVQSRLAPGGESGRPSLGREPLPEARCGRSWPRPPSRAAPRWGGDVGFPVELGPRRPRAGRRGSYLPEIPEARPAPGVCSGRWVRGHPGSWRGLGGSLL